MAELEKAYQKYPILKAFVESNISFELFEHEPVFTVEQGKELLALIPGNGTKNLFICDKKKIKYFLITLSEEKRVDLKKLGEILGTLHLSFGSQEKLFEYLKILPGSVTPLSMLVGDKQKVSFYLDSDLLQSELIQVHPMINSATIVVNPKELFEKLFPKNEIIVQKIIIPTINI